MRRSARALGHCAFHNKLLYLGRKAAKKVAREHREDHKSVYECSQVPGMFHVGGVPDQVISGDLTRGEYFSNYYQQGAAS